MKKASDIKVVKKRNGRFIVRKRGGAIVNGVEKTTVLLEKGLVKKLKSKPKAEAPAEA